MRECQVVTMKPNDPNFRPYSQPYKNYEAAVRAIKSWYDLGIDNSLTFLIQEREVPEWHSVGAWTIGDYLDGEEDFGK